MVIFCRCSTDWFFIISIINFVVLVTFLIVRQQSPRFNVSLLSEWISGGLHHHVRGLRGAGTQGGPLRLQPLLPENICGQPRQAPHHRAEGCPLLGDAVYPRLHVQGGDLGAGASADQPHKGRGVVEGTRADQLGPAATWREHLRLADQPEQQLPQPGRLLALAQPTGPQRWLRPRELAQAVAPVRTAQQRELPDVADGDWRARQPGAGQQLPAQEAGPAPPPQRRQRQLLAGPEQGGQPAAGLQQAGVPGQRGGQWGARRPSGPQS